MPLRVGERQLTGEWMLAGQESPEISEEWAQLTAEKDGRPLALLNPFGGNARLKGFTRPAFSDLAALISDLVDEGYFVIIAPSGQPWGTTRTCRDVLLMLDEQTQRYVTAVQEGSSPADFIQRLLSFVKRADIVVTVEGWMMHAAYLAGRPYRLLTLPASEPRTWQPWGRSVNQRPWVFTGAHLPGQIPLPEQPRKRAWIELLRRISDPRWEPILQRAVKSEDPDLRRAAISAIGRCGLSDARQLASWLDDPSHRVRASAAAMLLHYHRSALGDPPVPDSAWLEVVRSAGETVPQWNDVVAMGEQALPALDTLLHVEDSVTRREAALCIEAIRKSGLQQTDEDEVSVTRVSPDTTSAERGRSA